MHKPRRRTLALLTLTALFALVAPASAKDVRTAVILVHFKDAPNGQPAIYEAENIRPGIFGSAAKDKYSVREYYREQSHGQIDVVGSKNRGGDFFGSYEIEMKYPGGAPAGCDPGLFLQQAYPQAGINPDDYDAIVFLFQDSRCRFAGAGGGDSKLMYINGFNRYTIAHELGHAFGADHAQSLRCFGDSNDIVTLSDRCSLDEYGDPFDPMGSGGTQVEYMPTYSEAVPHQMEPIRKMRMGVLSGSSIRDVSASGTYHLNPIERSSGMRMLRVPTKDGEYLDLSFRRPLGVFDSTWLSPNFGNPRAFDGVVVNRDEKTNGSELLDMTPETATQNGFDDAPLRAGRSFTDPFTGVRLTVDGVGAAGADVTVNRGPGPLPDPSLTGLKLPSPVVSGRKAAITFKLNRIAPVSFRFARKDPGRRSGGKCVKPADAPGGASCMRWVTLTDRLLVQGKSGSNSVKFSGSIGKTRLAPGSYRLSGTPIGGGSGTKAVTALFSITED